MRLSTSARLAALVLALACPTGEARAAAPRAGAAPEVTVELAPNGRLTATGVLPEGLSPQQFGALLPGAEVSATERDGAGRSLAWGPAVEALAIVLPRFRTATARLSGKAIALEGALRPGLSASGVEAALRAALGTRWELELDLVEAASPAEIAIDKGEDGLAVSGLLPNGLAPSGALELLGEEAADAGLAGGGEGDPEGWSRALAALGETLDLFAWANARVSDGEAAIAGTLRPGYAREAVADRLGSRFAEGWALRLDAAETTPNEGDRRLDLATGEAQSFRRGYWLPDVDFPVSAERCRAETDAVLGGEGLPFIEGTAEIEASALPVVNRLAAIAIRCLNSSPIRLAIAGHTDSVGNDRANEELSRARAEAVRQALLDRGVRAEAVAATGYGESRPVATNNTPEGRQQNRRIAFDWQSPEG